MQPATEQGHTKAVQPDMARWSLVGGGRDATRIYRERQPTTRRGYLAQHVASREQGYLRTTVTYQDPRHIPNRSHTGVCGQWSCIPKY